MLNTVSAGGVILNTQNQVVVTNQYHTSWSLPKGHVNPDEKLLDAAKREIYEETGLTDLEFIKDLGNYQRESMNGQADPAKKELKNIHFFLFTTSQSELKPVDKDNPEAKWVEIEEVTNYFTHPEDKKFFESIKDIIATS